MKKLFIILIGIFSIQAVETIWWFVDRPLTDLPPMPSQIYRCPSNPVKRDSSRCRKPYYTPEQEKEFTRRDVIENIRRQQCTKKCRRH